MKLVKSIFILLMVTTALVVYATPRAEAAWPKDKPITMIVAFSPGGSTDVAARMVAVYIKKYLGQSVVVLNKPGASGEVGFTALAESKPDGYTVGFINTPSLLTHPIQHHTRFTLESFIPVAQLMDDPDAFYVLKDSPLNNLKDLVAYAKANPDKVTFGTSGIGSDDHIAAELFTQAAGIKMKHIPFPGSSANRTALLGGHVMVGVFNVSEGKEYVSTGKLKILGQMAEKRTDLFPNTPTFIEQGYDIVMSSSRGIAMPAGTPEEIVKKFADATEKALNDPEFKKKCKDADLPLKYLGPQAYLKVLQGDRTEFQKLWKTNPWIQNK